MARAMGLPQQPVTLTVEQIDDLNKKVSTLRHDIRKDLILMDDRPRTHPLQT